jgi:hypothetical protein
MLRANGTGCRCAMIGQFSLLEEYAIHHSGFLAEHQHAPAKRGQTDTRIVKEAGRYLDHKDIITADRTIFDVHLAGVFRKEKLPNRGHIDLSFGVCNEAIADFFNDINVREDRFDLRQAVHSRHVSALRKRRWSAWKA